MHSFFLIEKKYAYDIDICFQHSHNELKCNELAEILHCCGNFNLVMNLDIRFIIRVHQLI